MSDVMGTLYSFESKHMCITKKLKQICHFVLNNQSEMNMRDADRSKMFLHNAENDFKLETRDESLNGTCHDHVQVLPPLCTA